MRIVNMTGDVGRQFDDFDHPAMTVLYRHIIGFQPDWAAVFCHTQKLIAEAFAPVQSQPEILILPRLQLFRSAKQAVVLAFNLSQRVAHARQKQRVGAKNGAIGRELNHGDGAVERAQRGN